MLFRSPEGPTYFVAVESSQDSVRELGPGQLAASLTLTPAAKSNGASVVVLSLVDWNDDLQRQVAKWWEER